MTDTSLALPQDPEAEQAVIGSIIFEPTVIDEIANTVKAEDFSYANGLIYTALLDMAERGIRPDAITLGHRLEAMGRLADAGGPSHLLAVMDAVGHTAHFGYYVDIVLKFSKRRSLIYAGREIISAGHNLTVEIEDSVAQAESKLQSIIQRDAGSEAVSIADALLELSADWESERPRAIATGFADLDGIHNGGLSPGCLITLAARPGLGKTSAAICLARNVAQQNHGCLFVSLEQSRDEVTERLLSIESGVDLARFKKPKSLTAADHKRLADTMDALAGMPLRIHDSASVTVAQIAAQARLMKRRHDLKLLVVDYLQLVTPSDSKAPREQQVATISRTLKVLARDLDITVLSLAQLNRAVESRESKRPRLSDLRESGSIEQDSDSVWFLSPPENRQVQLHVAKHRHGATGDVSLGWNANRTQFHDSTTDDNWSPSR